MLCKAVGVVGGRVSRKIPAQGLEINPDDSTKIQMITMTLKVAPSQTYFHMYKFILQQGCNNLTVQGESNGDNAVEFCFCFFYVKPHTYLKCNQTLTREFETHKKH